MYYDGQNLEAESEEETNRLLEVIRGLGDVRVTENVDCHTLQVSKYTFLLQQGNSGWITMTGADEKSDEKLYDLYVQCGGEPQQTD